MRAHDVTAGAGCFAKLDERQPHTFAAAQSEVREVTTEEDLIAGVSVSEGGRAGLLHLAGELDALGVAGVEERLRQAARSRGDLTLDVSDISFMDSTGVRLLIQIAGQLDGTGKLIVVGPVGIVRRVLELMGVERVPNLEVR